LGLERRDAGWIARSPGGATPLSRVRGMRCEGSPARDACHVSGCRPRIRRFDGVHEEESRA
jgi:hypothetical protein